jgi:tetratricopeptide (TPR) repeat protein
MGTLLAVGLCVVALAGCAGPEVEIALPDLGTTESQVVERIEEAASRVRQHPDSAEAWGSLAMVLDAHGFLDEAVTHYRRAIELDPDDFEWTYLLAVALDTHGGDIKEISGLFEKAAELRSDYAPLYVNLGGALSRRGDIEAARRSMERAVELDPKLAAGHLGLGQLLLQVDETPLAIDHLERAAMLDPGDGSIFAALAQAYRLAGDPERAAKAAGLSRELKPRFGFPDSVRYAVHSLNTSAAAASARGAAAMDAGKYEEAITLLKQSDEWKPRSAAVQHNLGVCYLRTGRPDAAREHFEHAVSISDHAESHWRLAVMALEEGHPESALAHLRSAAEHAPDDGSLYGRIATAMARAGGGDEALKLFERAAELGSDSASLQNNWGAALLQLERDEEALDHFRRAIALDPGHPQAPLNAGALLEQLGRKEEAEQIYRIALSRDPNHAARQRLDNLERP